MKLFISYRRKSWPFTHRLADQLKALLPNADIFVDYTGVDEADFEQSILRHLRASDAVILVVSPETFTERIADAGDWVRREIREALERRKPLVLVLVEGLLPPPADQLPEDIRAVTRMQGIKFYPDYFEAGVQKLAEFIKKVTAQPTPAQQKQLEIMGDLTQTPARRARAGRELCKVRDPRPGVGLRGEVPALIWREVGEGPFIFQSGQQRELPTFYIAQYPITYIQFGAFIDAPDGYYEKAWWQGLAQRPDEPGEQLFANTDNHPRENVNWYEAMAFCRWLSARLGYEIRLPAEEEWEKAARGDDGRAYPWGDVYLSGYANINESNANHRVGQNYLRRTTAVGIYPQGASPCGALDMCGNVLEWTLTDFNTRDSSRLNDDVPRILRGGAYNNNYTRARTDYVFRAAPESRLKYAGFRVIAMNPK